MHFFDETDLLCDYINHVFMTCDDSGTCENVLPSPKHKTKPDGFPAVYHDEELQSNSDKDERSLSPDIRMDRKHRNRSNTAVMLEKLHETKQMQNACTKVNYSRRAMRSTAKDDTLIVSKVATDTPKVFTSLASKLINESPALVHNPFLEFAHFETVSNGKWFLIFFACLSDEEKRLIPTKVSVLSSAKVQDLLGLVCYKYTTESRNPPILSMSNYALFMAEENGEVEMDLPPLNNQETIARIGFSCLALQKVNSSNEETEELTKVTVYFTNGENFEVQLTGRDDTVLSIRDKALALRSKANTNDYFKYEYRVESVSKPFQTFDLSSTVQSTHCTEFVLIRKNASRGSFNPHRKISDEVNEKDVEAPLSPMCLFYSVTMKLANKTYVPTQLVICSDRIDIFPSMPNRSKTGKQSSFHFSTKRFRNAKNTDHTQTTLAMDCIGGVQVVDELEGRKSFRIVHLPEKSAGNHLEANTSSESPSKVHWTAHNFQASTKVVDQICIHLNKLLDTKQSRARLMYTSRGEFSRKPSFLRKVASFSRKKSGDDHFKSFDSHSARHDSAANDLANAYQINDDWMQ